MPANIRVLRGGAEVEAFELTLGKSAIVGRDPGCHVHLKDLRAARSHLRLHLLDHGLRIEDLFGDGVEVDGERLAEGPQVVSLPCTIRVGRHTLEVSEVEGAPAVWEEFQRERLLGAGGFGRVHAALRRADGRRVAIKEIELAGDEQGRDRFLREVQLTAELDHPNLIRVHEVRLEGDRAYQIMELIPGGRDLHDWIDEDAWLSLEDAVEVGLGMARGLEAIHRAGIIHRDIKPANVMITEDDQVKLVDFGLARGLEQGLTLTSSMMGVGTLAYSAPEQVIDAKRAGPEADLYGLGATLYHAIAGRAPFAPDRLLEDLVNAVIDEDPPPLSLVRSGCPRILADVVHRLLSKDPEARYPSAGIVIQRLAAVRSAL